MNNKQIKQIEVRMNKAEIRAQDDGSLKVSGYVNKTNQLSNILGSSKRFVEKISKGAFSKAIKNSTHDIDFLLEHDNSKILASTKNNSLHLREDSEGLFMEANIIPTSYGKDSHQLITSGIIKNMSFGFRVLKDSWNQLSNGLYERTVHELELMEVSAVKDPAYAQSTIAARGMNTENIIPKNIKERIKENEQMNKTEHRYAITKDSMEVEKRKSDYVEFRDILKEEKRAVSTTTDGASVIPESVADLIVEKISENSPIFNLAKKIPSQSGRVKIPYETDTEDAGFVGEGADLMDIALNLSEVELNQKRVGASITLTNQLINDSAINIVDYTASILAKSVARALEKSMLVGTGDTEFRGIVHEPIKSVDVTGTVSDITMDNLLDMYNSVHPSYLTNSAFIISREAYNHISKIKDGNGNYFLQNGIINGKPTRTIFGIEVFISASLNESNPVVFGNFTEGLSVMIKQNSGLQVITDTETALKGTKLILLDLYVDSVVSNPQALSKLTVSPQI